jgi:hypothetical protein
MIQDIHLPRFFWLWLPVVFFLGILVLEQLVSPGTRAFLVRENGPYEMLQVVILLTAVTLSAQTLRRMPRQPAWMMGWVVLALAGSFYCLMEETSWGQQFLRWDTPELWSRVNDQNETNLHNTSDWLDQKPRLLMIIGIYVGGMIMPLVDRFKRNAFPPQFTFIYPARQMAVIAVICLIVKILDISGDATNWHVLGRAAETEELFLFYFVAIYMADMKHRLRQSGAS